MNQKTVFLILLALVLFCIFISIIKNKPDYLVLLGIRGLLSYILIQFLKFLCSAAHTSVLLTGNPITICVGAILGFPGILLLSLLRICFAA